MPTNPARPTPARRGAQAVTTAPRSRDDDRHRRMRTYVIAMVIRTLSFPLAVWAFLSGQVVLGWVLMAAAVLIPSVAVGLANAVDHRGESEQDGPRSPVQALGSAPVPARDDEPSAPTVVEGTVVQGSVVERTVVEGTVVPPPVDKKAS